MLNTSTIYSKIMYYIILVILLPIIMYLAAAGYLYIFQRNIIYLPGKYMAGPENYGLTNTQKIILTTNDQVKITTWLSVTNKKNPYLIYLHGNAGNLGDRTEKLTSLTSEGFNVLAVSYRGYGDSEGSPSEEGLYNDGRAAINYLLQNNIPLEKIVLYGESLGSGVAIQIASEYHISGLILEAPYTSISKRAKEVYPYMPIDMLLKDKFNTIEKITKLHIPLLIFHGYRDEVMPIDHGRKLLAAANEPKEARFFENTGHTDFDYKQLAKISMEFVKKHLN